ncbi:hypothetical protein GCM10010350_80260 [Streptomyces galilaeus]|nr:hypothetical protein GCM10010350_80260 [Streptomyces galilaeus]
MFVQLKTGYDIDRGPRRDRGDLRFGPGQPTVEGDAEDAYGAFLRGSNPRDQEPQARTSRSRVRPG